MDLGAVPYECGVKSGPWWSSDKSDRNVYALLSPADLAKWRECFGNVNF